jgi:phospholipid/cholesterol/gamma-HCH transport system ATP-binding protein
VQWKGDLHPQHRLYDRKMKSIAAFILAGGRSSRMGTDKAFLELGGEPLIARAVELAHEVAAEVKIVGNPEKFGAYGPVVADVYRDRGPLGGIHAALKDTDAEWNLMLAVDLPFLTAPFLYYLLQRAQSADAMVTVPSSGGYFQPLCAVYRKQFADLAERALAEGRNKIDQLFRGASVCIVSEEDMVTNGFTPSIFRNLNTPEEWEEARGEFVSKSPYMMGTTRMEEETAHSSPEINQSIPEPGSEEVERTEEQGPYIQFRDVSKAFGEKQVLSDVGFEVNNGETVCILGRSGVGKSVALQHILGFLRPDSGRVIVAYEDITDYSEKEMERIRKKVTMVFQNGALFDSLTVGENVAFPLRERGDLSEDQILQIVSGLLDMVGVKEMADQLPAELSTGMKRSVAIARALASQPECVLYDEPTTMVDPLMGQLLGDLMKRLKFQLHLTSVVVTHDMRLAKKLADKVVFLHESKVIFYGTYADMEKSDEPIVQEFLELDRLDLGA